jgi:hypothetical protein
MPIYPKYHPPIDWPYAVAPAGREYRVLPSPAQRIGKKEARLWGATVQSVPYAYEDPYLTSVQDTQYTVDSSMMHRYPYLREGESAPRFPMLFQQPFGSANIQQGSANYLDSYAYDDEEESSEDDDFGFDIGEALKKAQGFIEDNKIQQRIKDGKGIIATVQKSGIFGKKNKKKKSKKRSSKRKSRSAKSSSYKKGKIPAFLKSKGLPFASQSFQSVAKLATDAQAMQNIPEPTPFSNLFAQAAENDKVNVKARITAGQQVPILVRETPNPRQMVASEQLHSAEVELTKRAQDVQRASEKLEKSQNKNNVLLYTSIGGGVVTLGLLSYLLISRK